MTNFKKVLVLITALIVSLIVVFFSSEWNRAAFGSRGSIENGTKFGVTIGDNIGDAIALLKKRGMKEYDLQNTPTINPRICHGKIYDENLKVQLFTDRSWRRGSICLISISGDIVHFSWNYGMLQP